MVTNNLLTPQDTADRGNIYLLFNKNRYCTCSVPLCLRMDVTLVRILSNQT